VTRRAFHLGDILSITTGKLVAPRGMDAVYDILNFMTGESLYTHQLPRAAEACKPALIGQHPQLADADASGVGDPTTAHDFLRVQIATFGEFLDVEPLLPNAYVAMDPLEELATMVPPHRITVVKVDA
jgi:hypothetical protein